MAQGDILLNADGTVALNGAGLVRLVDVDSDCPDCCDSCTTDNTYSCSSCTDVPALTQVQDYTATFSLVALCTGCNTTDQIRWKAGFSNATINTAHTLTQISGCTWRKTIASAAEQEDSADECGGAGTTPYALDVVITLTRGASDWTLTIELLTAFPASRGRMFYDQRAETAAGVCLTVPSFTNDHDGTIIECFDSYVARTVVGTGGSATVVCV